MTHSPHANFSDSFAKRALIYFILFVGLIFGALNAVGAFGHEQALSDQEGTIFKSEQVIEKPAILKVDSPEDVTPSTIALPVANANLTGKSNSKVNVFTSADFYNQSAHSFVPQDEMSRTLTYLDVISAKKVALSPNSSPLTGSGITIGIVDSGINTKLDALKNLNNVSRLIAQGCSGTDASLAACDSNEPASAQCSDFVIGCYHGTAVADLAAGKRFKVSIAGRSNTFTGGVAPDANISFSRVTLSKTGELDENVLRDGLQKFLNDVNANSAVAPDVINLSIGFARDGKYSDCNAPSEITNIINALVARGVTVVASSGNGGDKNQIMYPACLSNVIAVGASEYEVNGNSIVNEKIADYSQSSADLDLVAPGSDLLTSLPAIGKYAIMKGTSFAAPIVTGAIAILKQANRNLTPAQIQSLLTQGADQVRDPANGRTYSRINVLNSLKLISTNAISVQ